MSLLDINGTYGGVYFSPRLTLPVYTYRFVSGNDMMRFAICINFLMGYFCGGREEQRSRKFGRLSQTWQRNSSINQWQSVAPVSSWETNVLT
ncbi:hypothetical protein K439DRAFT_858592 [Ramaria rubella]|nr:hypothetical protein K439DRAFT_858592 [Ramaria rubella]